MTTAAWISLSPVLLAFAVALAALTADALATPRLASRVAAWGLLLAGALAALSEGTGAVGTSFTLDWSRSLFPLVFGIAALALFSSARLEQQPHGGQVAALVAFSAAGSALLLSSIDLAALVVTLEIVGLAGYALVAAGRTRRAYEAAMRYFMQGAVATGLLAYGVAVLFGLFGGSVAYGVLAAGVTQGARGAVTAVALLLAALAFKVGAFPFHSWAPDAYETAPVPAAAFLATVPKLAGLLAIASLLLTALPGQRAVWLPLVAVLAAGSIVFGNLGALRQTSFRRMLGYSGIAQVGYALVALTGPAGTEAALPVFAATYALAASGAFLVAEAAGEGAGWDGSVAGLAGLGRRRPALASALAVCLLSLTGIPLTAGFVGKFLAFGAAVASGYIWLAALGVLGSVVSFGYYGAVLRSVYLDDTAESPEPAPVVAHATDEADALDGGVGELVPRSVGARAAEDARETRTWPVLLLAISVLVAGIAPLFTGRWPF